RFAQFLHSGTWLSCFVCDRAVMDVYMKSARNRVFLKNPVSSAFMLRCDRKVMVCLFLLTESRYFPARLIQTGPVRRDGKNDPAGIYTIIDLDLSKYDRVAMRFQKEQDNDISFLKSGIETRSQDFNALIERIERVAINSSDHIDRFDRVQLTDVLNVIRESKTLAEAGRKLFAVSRQSKKKW
ncbi:MAG: hypothetical protein GY749_49360, partial [Desulfobacteraceae bacterium]|nr:hypothetical protein [Desulfobacteraceae bacterium]